MLESITFFTCNTGRRTRTDNSTRSSPHHGPANASRRQFACGNPTRRMVPDAALSQNVIAANLGSRRPRDSQIPDCERPDLISIGPRYRIPQIS